LNLSRQKDGGEMLTPI